jgi:hyaluronate lyase
MTPLIPGTCEVYLWWTEYASRPTSVPVDIVHAGGTTTVYVNQRTNGGQWNSVGVYTFGTNGTITSPTVW